MAAKAKCLCGECGQPPDGSRGLSINCYATAKQRVRDGLTTWAELEAAGLVLPARRGKKATGIGRKIDELIASR